MSDPQELNAFQAVALLRHRMPEGWSVSAISDCEIVLVTPFGETTVFPVSPEYGGFWNLREDVQIVVQTATTERCETLDERPSDPP